MFTDNEIERLRKKGVNIIHQNANLQIHNLRSLPNNAYLVKLDYLGNILYDIVQGTKVAIFDAYYDHYGKDVIQRIDFSEGRMNPKLMPPPNKK